LRDQRASAPDLRPSLGHICVYLGFEETDEALGLDGTNLWIYPDEKHDENLARFIDDPKAPIPFVYASFPSAKDPAFGARHPGRATVDVLAGARFEWFAPWADRPWRRRGTDYDALKDSLADRMLEIFFAKLPHLRGKVAYREVSTPITTAHFSGHPHGEMCGLDHTPQRFAKNPGPRTEIPGLFLTGQDVALVGVGGAFTAGALAASAIEGPAVLRGIVWDES
jgi:phytoene dehydrogenase-like protein